jgi:isoleucyl-tRNA synthetase
VLVALDTQVDDVLAAEGLAREVAHRIQNLRKAAGLEISDRIVVAVASSPEVVAQLAAPRDWLAGETLAESIDIGPDADLADATARDEAALDGMALRLALRRAG